MPQTYTAEQRQEAIELYRKVGPCEASRRLSIPKSTIGMWAKQAGARTDSAILTREATAAAAARNASRRAELAAKYLEDADRLRAALWEPCNVYSFGGRDNVFREATAKVPDARARRDLMTASTSAAQQSLALERHDTENDHSAVLEYLQRMKGDA